MVGNGLGQSPEAGFAFAQGVFGHAPCGHVLYHAAHLHRPPGRVAHEFGAPGDPAQFAVVGATNPIFGVKGGAAVATTAAARHRPERVDLQCLDLRAVEHRPVFRQPEGAAESRRYAQRVGRYVEQEHTHTAGRLRKAPLVGGLAQQCLAHGQRTRGLDARGALADDAQHTADTAVELVHGRVREVEKDLFAPAVTLGVAGPVLPRHGLALAGQQQLRMQLAPHIGPMARGRLPEAGRMLVRHCGGIAVVVEGDEVFAPEQRHLGLRGKHHIDRRAQRHRPAGGRAQRRVAVAKRAQPACHLSVANGPLVGR